MRYGDELYTEAEWAEARRYAFDTEDTADLVWMEQRQRAHEIWMRMGEKNQEYWFCFDTWFDRIGRSYAIQSM